MLEKLYDKLNQFHDFEIKKISMEEIKRKETALQVAFPESMKDFYCYYENSEEIRNAFYLICSLDGLRIENSGLEFGYTTQAQAILGIRLNDLQNGSSPISYHAQDDEIWYLEGAPSSKAFFFNIVAWHIVNLMRPIGRIAMSEKEFMRLCEKEFSFFSDEPEINDDYRVHSCWRKGVLGCYLINEEQFYVGAKTDEDLEELEEDLGWEDELEWL